MEARAKLLGHPIHQMLIVLPLGLLSGVVIFDVVHLLTDDRQWVTVSYWLIPAGLATGVLAAVFGAADWMKIPAGTRAKGVGARHAIGNVMVLLLFFLSWILRGSALDEPGALALLLAFAGGGLSAVTGWLGGELVSRLGIGVYDDAHVDAPSSLSGRAAHDR